MVREYPPHKGPSYAPDPGCINNDHLLNRIGHRKSSRIDVAAFFVSAKAHCARAPPPVFNPTGSRQWGIYLAADRCYNTCPPR